MAKKSNVDFSGLAKYIEDYAKEVGARVAARARDELYDEAKTAIEAFYNSYSPVYYRRHYYNFYNKSFKKYYSNAHGIIFKGGVELTPENLDSIYRASTDLVFDTVYAGLHGPADFGYGWGGIHYEFMNNNPMGDNGGSAIPMEIITKKRDYIVAHLQEYIDDAQKGM